MARGTGEAADSTPSVVPRTGGAANRRGGEPRAGESAGRRIGTAANRRGREQPGRLARSTGVRAWLLALLMACRAGEPATPGGAPAPRLPVAPPSGAIVAVAITEAGDAAISFDEGGGWRLWPALDGTREPVVLQAS